MNIPVIFLMTTFLYSDFICLYFYNRVFEKRFSIKIQICLTFGLLCLECLVRVLPQRLWGVPQSGIMTVVIICASLLYAYVLFKESLLKICLVTALYYVVQATMDVVGIKLTNLIIGSYNIHDGIFLWVVTVCSSILVTLGAVILVQLWKVFESKNWKVEGYQWLSVFLPLSQYIILQQASLQFSENTINVPSMLIAGLILGILADIYMFVLFARMNDKKEAERELIYLIYQYELEKMRYEELLEVQEETEKIRHDFQNYLILLKNIE